MDKKGKRKNQVHFGASLYFLTFLQCWPRYQGLSFGACSSILMLIRMEPEFIHIHGLFQWLSSLHLLDGKSLYELKLKQDTFHGKVPSSFDGKYYCIIRTLPSFNQPTTTFKNHLFHSFI